MLLAALLCACSAFDAPGEFLEEYGNFASVESVAYSRAGVSNGGYLAIDSSDDFTISYTIDNPKNYDISVAFGENIPDTAVTSVDSNTSVTITYPASYLAGVDGQTSLYDISPEITISWGDDDYRKSFDRRNIVCNSPPPEITNALSQIYSDSASSINERLVLCFDIPSLPSDISTLTLVDYRGGASHVFDISSGISSGDEADGWTLYTAAPGGLGATYDGGPVFSHSSGTACYVVTDIENLKSLSVFNVRISLSDEGGLTSGITIPSHTLKLEAPTCSAASANLTNTFEAPYAEFTIYAPSNASDATLHFELLDPDNNPVADTSGSTSAHRGNTTFRLYPATNGLARTYTVTTAYATKSGYLDSDDAAASFGSSGSVSVSGVQLSTPESNLTDGGSYAQGITLTITSAENASITYTGTGFDTDTKDSPVTLTLEAAGSVLISAKAYKDYYKESQFLNATYNINCTRVYIKSDGDDANGNGTKEKPYATFAKALSAFGDSSDSANVIYILDDMTSLTSGISIGNGYYNIVGCKNGNAGAAVKLNIVSDGSVVQISGGTITLKAITITGNTNSSGGAVFIADGNLVLKENVVVTGNTRSDGSSANIWLAHGKTLKIDSDGISGTKVGVNLGYPPQNGNPVTITSGYGDAMGTAAPTSYFTSDASYAVVLESGEVVLKIGGGGIGIGDVYSVAFDIASTDGGIYKFSAAASANGGAADDVTSEITSWSMKLYQGNAYTGTSSATNSLNMNSYESGTYIVKIAAVYKGTEYSGEVSLTKP